MLNCHSQDLDEAVALLFLAAAIIMLMAMIIPFTSARTATTSNVELKESGGGGREDGEGEEIQGLHALRHEQL